MSSPSLALQEAMRAALLAHAPLRLLLGGAHVHEELPRGARPPFVLFETIETRDWSVADQKAHEHFVALSVKTNSRSRRLAQQVLDEVNALLSGRMVTELKLLDNYSAAEAYHQDYFEDNPTQGYCAFVVAPKVKKFVQTFADKVRHG